MKSTIKIDVDSENNPIIIFKVAKKSDDLRDKFAKQFIENIGPDNTTLSVKCLDGDRVGEWEDGYSEWEIKPGALSNFDWPQIVVQLAEALNLKELEPNYWQHKTDGSFWVLTNAGFIKKS